jgi:IS30 family transposase
VPDRPTRTCRPWTYPEVCELRRLAAVGYSDAAIARRLGRPRASVERKRWRLGAAKYRRHGGHDALIRRLARDGWYDREIGERLGMPRSNVERVRRRLGIPAGRYAEPHALHQDRHESARLARAGERQSA